MATKGKTPQKLAGSDKEFVLNELRLGHGNAEPGMPDFMIETVDYGGSVALKPLSVPSAQLLYFTAQEFKEFLANPEIKNRLIDDGRITSDDYGLSRGSAYSKPAHEYLNSMKSVPPMTLEDKFRHMSEGLALQGDMSSIAAMHPGGIGGVSMIITGSSRDHKAGLMCVGGNNAIIHASEKDILKYLQRPEIAKLKVEIPGGKEDIYMTAGIYAALRERELKSEAVSGKKVSIFTGHVADSAPQQNTTSAADMSNVRAVALRALSIKSEGKMDERDMNGLINKAERHLIEQGKDVGPYNLAIQSLKEAEHGKMIDHLTTGARHNVVKAATEGVKPEEAAQHQHKAKNKTLLDDDGPWVSGNRGQHGP